MEVQIESSWKEVVKEEFNKPYFKQIVNHLKTEKEQGKTIYPPGSLIFNAFKKTPFPEVKVVLLGQDPYHGPKQAHGLSFSVQRGIPPPPSLVNIFKELHEDTGTPIPQHGNLEKWAEQGVLLLKRLINRPGSRTMSHSKIGWEKFTNTVIEKVSELKEHIVFLLWGRFAQEKIFLVNEKKHLILKAAHPSPLSANNGFFGCRHFSKTNEYLVKKGIDPIDWAL